MLVTLPPLPFPAAASRVTTAFRVRAWVLWFAPLPPPSSSTKAAAIPDEPSASTAGTATCLWALNKRMAALSPVAPPARLSRRSVVRLHRLFPAWVSATLGGNAVACQGGCDDYRDVYYTANRVLASELLLAVLPQRACNYGAAAITRSRSTCAARWDACCLS